MKSAPPAIIAIAAVAAIAAPPAPQDAADALLAHWKLDDPQDSTIAADAAPRALRGKLAAGPSWTTGQIGGALAFNGKGAHLALPNSPELDKLQEESFTIMAWFKADDVPPGTEAQNNASYAVVIKAGWHEGLHYTNEKKMAMDHWLKGDTEDEPVSAGTESESELEPGRFHHVAGVVDRKSGTTRVYVNGSLDGTEEWEAGRAARNFEGGPWRVGIAEPDAEDWGWPAKGAVDDVRFYSRALTAEQIRAIYEAGKKP
jgi:hypothetical protein